MQYRRVVVIKNLELHAVKPRQPAVSAQPQITIRVWVTAVTLFCGSPFSTCHVRVK